jgi:hypothetical protein
MEAQCAQRFVERIVSMQKVMGKEFGVLFVADAVIYKHEPVAVFHEHAAHGPGAHIVIVCRVEFVPDTFGHNAEHGAAVEFEKAGIDRV